jgi:hypothetical protein
MERTQVDSSHIKSVGHDPVANKLEVEFKSGKVYQYDGVHHSEFNKLLSHPSIGEAFHRIIRTKATPASNPSRRPFKFTKIQ